jgi:hypothetical protein
MSVSTKSAGIVALLLASTLSVNALAAAVARITEVDAGGSGTSSYGVDWFELTNTGDASLTLTGWKMDDNTFSFASAVALGGVSTIAPGKSAIFMETSAANLASKQTSFSSVWFGGTAPVGLQFGYYSGGGVGLSQTADGVILFNAGGSQMAKVSFGAMSTNTFDNALGLDNATLTTFSAVGVNGAFAGSDGRIGSPGAVSAVPVPAAVWLLGSALGALALRRRKA